MFLLPKNKKTFRLQRTKGSSRYHLCSQDSLFDHPVHSNRVTDGSGPSYPAFPDLQTAYLRATFDGLRLGNLAADGFPSLKGKNPSTPPSHRITYQYILFLFIILHGFKKWVKQKHNMPSPNIVNRSKPIRKNGRTNERIHPLPHVRHLLSTPTKGFPARYDIKTANNAADKTDSFGLSTKKHPHFFQPIPNVWRIKSYMPWGLAKKTSNKTVT